MSRQATDYSVPLQVSEVPKLGRTFRITPSEAERAAIARIIGLPAIAALDAELHVEPFGREGVAVTGTIRARLTQVCVVSSEPFESDVTAPVDIRFSPDGRDPNADVDLNEIMDVDAEDPPDLLVGGRIDLGAIIVEFLALALDPYPRKPGVEFRQSQEEGEASPFAALKSLKSDQ